MVITARHGEFLRENPPSSLFLIKKQHNLCFALTNREPSHKFMIICIIDCGRSNIERRTLLFVARNQTIRYYPSHHLPVCQLHVLLHSWYHHVNNALPLLFPRRVAIFMDRRERPNTTTGEERHRPIIQIKLKQLLHESSCFLSPIFLWVQTANWFNKIKI